MAGGAPPIPLNRKGVVLSAHDNVSHPWPNFPGRCGSHLQFAKGFTDILDNCEWLLNIESWSSKACLNSIETRCHCTGINAINYNTFEKTDAIAHFAILAANVNSETRCRFSVLHINIECFKVSVKFSIGLRRTLLSPIQSPGGRVKRNVQRLDDSESKELVWARAYQPTRELIDQSGRDPQTRWPKGLTLDSSMCRFTGISTVLFDAKVNAFRIGPACTL